MPSSARVMPRRIERAHPLAMDTTDVAARAIPGSTPVRNCKRSLPPGTAAATTAPAATPAPATPAPTALAVERRPAGAARRYCARHHALARTERGLAVDHLRHGSQRLGPFGAQGEASRCHPVLVGFPADAVSGAGNRPQTFLGLQPGHDPVGYLRGITRHDRPLDETIRPEPASFVVRGRGGSHLLPNRPFHDGIVQSELAGDSADLVGGERLSVVALRLDANRSLEHPL